MKIVNSNRFYLPGTGTSFLHLATLTDGPRTFLCFYQVVGHKVYIEELFQSRLEAIKDDNLWGDLFIHLLEHKALKEPFLPDPTNEDKPISVFIPRKRFKAT